jgi:hypothetical protein
MSDYQPALDALRKIRLSDDDEQYDGLSRLLVRACDRAAAWDARLDPYVTWRDTDRDFIDSGLPKLLSAVEKIEEIARANPKPFDAVVWRAVHRAGANSGILSPAGYDFRLSGQSGAFVRELLAALRKDLQGEKNPTTRHMVKGKQAEGLHFHVLGPLHFPARIDIVRQPNARITGLQFELVFHLRRYSAHKLSREIRTLDKLPEFGDPLYRIVGEFLKCAANHFPPEDRDELKRRDKAKGIIDGEAFAKVIRENAQPDGSLVRWWGWGAPENPLEDRVGFLLEGDTDD